MLLIAIPWAAVGAFMIAVGLEPEHKWKTVLGPEVTPALRKGMLMGGGVVSFSAIFVSFFLLVLSNALIVFGVWLFVFMLSRVIIEALSRKNSYLEKDDLDREQEKTRAASKLQAKPKPSDPNSPLMDPLAPPTIQPTARAKPEAGVENPELAAPPAENLSDSPQFADIYNRLNSSKKE